VFASCLALSFVSRTSDVDGDRHSNVRVQVERNSVNANGLESVWQVNLVALDDVAVSCESFDDITRCNRTVQQASFTSLANHDDCVTVEAFSNASRCSAAFFVALFDVSTLSFELLAVGFSSAQCLALWEQEVTCKAVLYGDFVADGAGAGDAFEQNDPHVNCPVGCAVL